MASVSLRNITKRFGATDIIRGVSVEIADGEFVVLVGPSGCGKSTLLRMIAGLEEVGGGEIAIDGVVVNDMAPKQRDIAMVFQNYALYPHMTVAENMGFSLKLKGVARNKVAARVAEAAKSLGLEALLARYPRELSGGQRQRVATGRAIVRDPKVFLFDEPLSNLDAKLRVQMRSEIKQLHQRLKTTTLYVTHDQIEAMTMASKIVVLRDGKVEQTGAPLALYDHPDNIFVAGFIGSPAMNFLPGTLDEDAVILADGARVALDAEQPRPATGSAVTYGIRPEHLEIVAADTPGALAAEVVVVEPTGSETLLLLRLSGASVTVVTRERHGFHPGEHIAVRPALGRAHLFDGQGRRAG